MGKSNNAPSTEGATPEEVVGTALVAETPEEVVETALVAEFTNENENEVEVIPSNVFVAIDGTEVEFAVQHFIYKKRKYTVEEAVAEIPEDLQDLYDRKSFIFKKA